jgi:hypothetical protein
MRYLITFLSLALLLSCSRQTAPAAAAQTQAPTTPAVPTKITFVTWDKKMVDLGTVKKGEKRTTSFEFTNTSGGDIQIDIVDACECTKVEFPRGIIPPGGKGRLGVTFDSTEKDASETIGINTVFKQNDAKGNPRIEVVEYKFELVK